MNPIPYLLQPPNAPVPGLGEQLATAQQGQQQLARLPAPMMAAPMAGPSLPALSAAVMPAAHQNQVLTDEAHRNYLLNSGSGVQQITHPVDANGNPTGQHISAGRKILGGLATAGDIATQIAGSVFLPAHAIAAAIPGTTFHHQMLLHQATQNLANDQAVQKQDADLAQQQAQTGLTEAQTGYAKQRPAIEQSKLDQKQQAVRDRVTQAAAARGQNVSWDADGVPTFADDTASQAYQDNVSLASLHQANANKAGIAAEIQQNHYVPGTPEYAEAQRRLSQADQKIQVAMGNLGLRAQGLQLTRDNYLANNMGVGPDHQPLAGAMVSDDGRSVGSHFSGNVRPTGQERNKADMASSAEEQLSDIKSIMQRHPTLFGPGYGQASEFKKWLGSQDADAQRFLAARTIAADHLAGTFGGRSEAALDALDKAIGQFKDNPNAAIAGIDQLTKANKRFEKAGTVNTVGGGNSSDGPPAGAKVRDYTQLGGGK